MNTVLLGFLGCGSVAAISYFVSQFLGNKSNVKDIAHSITQKFKKEKINDIEKEQISILKSIEENEKLSEEMKVKIKEIKKETNKKIVEILSSDNKFSELLKEGNLLW